MKKILIILVGVIFTNILTGCGLSKEYGYFHGANARYLGTIGEYHYFLGDDNKSYVLNEHGEIDTELNKPRECGTSFIAESRFYQVNENQLVDCDFYVGNPTNAFEMPIISEMTYPEEYNDIGNRSDYVWSNSVKMLFVNTTFFYGDVKSIDEFNVGLYMYSFETDEIKVLDYYEDSFGEERVLFAYQYINEDETYIYVRAKNDIITINKKTLELKREYLISEESWQKTNDMEVVYATKEYYITKSEKKHRIDGGGLEEVEKISYHLTKVNHNGEIIEEIEIIQNKEDIYRFDEYGSSMADYFIKHEDSFVLVKRREVDKRRQTTFEYYNTDFGREPQKDFILDIAVLNVNIAYDNTFILEEGIAYLRPYNTPHKGRIYIYKLDENKLYKGDILE